jgi:hypothetical protein
METDLSLCPEALRKAAQKWQAEHPNDVLFTVSDNQDVLFLSETAQEVIWINPEGEVHKTVARWQDLGGYNV